MTCRLIRCLLLQAPVAFRLRSQLLRQESGRCDFAEQLEDVWLI